MKLLSSFLKSDPSAQLRLSRGRLVAQLLAGAWRRLPPPLTHSAEELAEIAPLLLKSGGGALAWCRVRNTDLRAAPPAPAAGGGGWGGAARGAGGGGGGFLGGAPPPNPAPRPPRGGGFPAGQ